MLPARTSRQTWRRAMRPGGAARTVLPPPPAATRQPRQNAPWRYVREGNGPVVGYLERHTRCGWLQPASADPRLENRARALVGCDEQWLEIASRPPVQWRDGRGPALRHSHWAVGHRVEPGGCFYDD
jgi:hypothetical protein